LAPTTVYHYFRNGYVQSYNLNLQQQLSNTIALQIGYFGNKGTHLRMARNLNQPDPVTGLRPYPTLSDTSPISPGTKLNNVVEYDSSANSNYNALWVTVTKRFSNGLQFNSSYTWSKSLDYNSLSSQGIILQNSYDPRSNYGPSDFDARHRWVLSGVYSLPFQRNRFIAGWQISTIVQLQTGNPVNIVTRSLYNGSVGTIRPNLLAPVSTSYSVLPSGNVQYLPQSLCITASPGCVFQYQASGFGDLGRNTIYGPGFEDIDMALVKDTRVTEKVTVQFRADAFNLFNHPNFGQPVNTISTTTSANGTVTLSPGSFGQITSTRFPVGDSGSSRQIQLALRLMF
jgi:hypothetical protein